MWGSFLGGRGVVCILFPIALLMARMTPNFAFSISRMILEQGLEAGLENKGHSIFYADSPGGQICGASRKARSLVYPRWELCEQFNFFGMLFFCAMGIVT